MHHNTSTPAGEIGPWTPEFFSIQPGLPVSERSEEIIAALCEHPVVIVCGETGSGKTTQLPKMAALANLRRGIAGGGRVAHTQPRRIAATSVATRIAAELKTTLGQAVGYKIRFSDRSSQSSVIKLMTDGILLAELASDPLLKAYDTIIIDEAHERSLNIDFLLGYLKQLLPRRPDLRVVVTSATIDAQRFADHFALGGQGAPVIQVSGRLYPVEVRWRPFQESREEGWPEAICRAMDELWQIGPGDILVFLPGEREIREAAEALRRHLGTSRSAAGVPELLPLYARLSQSEQDRVFRPSGQWRIILATNVAETSLTVPGIRYVIDLGLARVKRYSYRSKIEQLLIEPISRAAAQQRSGRCGRVSQGVCIRLYDEADFNQRLAFTDPEILRSSLAAVILKMKSMRLGAVEQFPFVQPPSGRAIADGYALLQELQAVDEQHELTPMGRQLSKLPLDPRIARILMEAKHRTCLNEALIICSALSVQDVRERPQEQGAAADLKHKPFEDERSEFMGYCKLWAWLENLRTPSSLAHKLSHRQQELALRDHFISPRRVREWRDVHAQLRELVQQLGWTVTSSEATYEQVHLSLLAGLLGNVGCKDDESQAYLGARGIRFWQHPGVRLNKRGSRWVVAGELVETSKLYGRRWAQIEPTWITTVASHLLKRQWLDPRFDPKWGEVVAVERATLYGLVIYNQRKVAFSRIDPTQAREVFIKEALVQDALRPAQSFQDFNRKLITQVEELEHKSRRQDVLVDEQMLFEFYDRKLPAEVCSLSTLERWLRIEPQAHDQSLRMSREDLMRHQAESVSASAFPALIRLGGVDCAASYLHQPGDPADGLTVTIPLFALNQVDELRSEWLVPGMLRDKVIALLKSLPPRPRSRLAPLPAFCDEFCSATAFAQGALIQVLTAAVRTHTQLPIQAADFKLEMLPAHLWMNFRLVDDHGRYVDMSRQLSSLKAKWGGHARNAFQALAQIKVKPQRSLADHSPVTQTSVSHPVAGNAATPAAGNALFEGNFTQWEFGDWPELLEIKKGNQVLLGYPAMIDCHTHVSCDVFDDPAQAHEKHRAGLRRLFALQLRENIKALGKSLLKTSSLSTTVEGTIDWDRMRTVIIELAIERSFMATPWPRDRGEFEQRLEQGRVRFGLVAQEVERMISIYLTEWAQAHRKLRDARAARATTDDIAQQLQGLNPVYCVQHTPWEVLAHIPRYLKAVSLRIDKYRQDPARDASAMAAMKPLEQRYTRRLAELKGRQDARLQEFRWLLEELRVSLFAQELRTAQPVSVKRLEKVWSQLIAA